MCWHLGAGLATRGRMRWLSFTALALAAAGLVASGSRGPWIAAAVAVPALLVVIPIRRPAMRRPALLLVALGVVLAAAAWPVAKRMIVPRVEIAIAEVQDARAGREYVTSAGLRIGLWKWAIEIAGTAPVAGTGAGSYQDELWKIDEYDAIVEAERPDEERVEFLTRDHAHSTYLHALATTGGIGALLLVAVVAMTAWRCVRLTPDHPYADATLFALVTWIVGAQFDCYHLNGHLFGLFMLIVTISLRTPEE
jgi:O-antigen ligase